MNIVSASAITALAFVMFNMSVQLSVQSETELIVSDNSYMNLYRIKAASGLTTEVFNESIGQPIAIAFSEFDGYIYWSETSPNRIMRHKLLCGTDDIEIVYENDTNVNPIHDMVLDVVDKVIYYSQDVDIQSVSTNGTGHRIFIQNQNPNTNIYYLDLDQTNRWIYWTTEYKIMKAELGNATNQQIVLNINTFHIGLAIDSDADLLYYSTDDPSRIFSARLDGTDISLIYEDQSYSFGESLTLSTEYIFFTIWNWNWTNQIKKIHRESFQVSFVSNKIFQDINDIISINISPDLTTTDASTTEMQTTDAVTDTSPAAVTTKNPTCAEKFAAKYPERVQQETSKPKLVCRRRV